MNVDILGISELKQTGMGEFNSDDHYIYDCGQESVRRNGIAIMVNKSLKCRAKANRVLPREHTGHRKHPLQQHKRRLYTWTSPDGQQ